MIKKKCIECKIKEAKNKFCSKHCSNIYRHKHNPLWHKKMIIAAAKVCKGKTIEERLGIDRAKIFKHKQSLSHIGKRNANFEGKYSKFEGAIKWQKEHGHTRIEKYGEERAKQINEKIKQKISGKNSVRYGKSPMPGSGNGWNGWYNGYFFRSLLELSYIKYFLDNNIKFQSAETKEFMIEYIHNGKSKTYKPDFYLPEQDLIIECKPKSLLTIKENIIKFEYAKKKFGNKFIIKTDKTISLVNFKELLEMKKSGKLKLRDKWNKRLEEYKI